MFYVHISGNSKSSAKKKKKNNIALASYLL